jgi:peptide/nickel transport system substrate-binding protein
MYQNYIIPRRAIEKNWDLGKFPVGSGAYKFKEYVTDTSVTLVKNDDFWKKPALDKIVYKFITDKSVSAMALQNKEIDIALAILPTELENIVNKDYLVLAPSAIGSLRWIGFNCKLDIFSDPKVRRALAMAVNMDGAIAAIFKNNVGAKLAVRAYGCISYERPGGDLESNKAVTPQYNPKEAMKILDELGWKRGRDGIREKDGKKLSFILQVGNNDANREKLSVIVATQLKAIGVDCTARTAEWATHTSDIAKGNVQMYILGGYGNLDGGKRLMETNPNRFSPNCGYSNPEVDKLIKEAFRTLDYDKRCDLLRRADNIFSSECPHLGGYFEYSQMAYNKRVTDFGYATVYQALCSPMRNVGVSD